MVAHVCVNVHEPVRVQPLTPVYVALSAPFAAVPAIANVQLAPPTSITPLPVNEAPESDSATDSTVDVAPTVNVIVPPAFDPCCASTMVPVCAPATLSVTGPAYSPAIAAGAEGTGAAEVLPP